MSEKILLDPESKYLEEYLFFENPNLYNMSHKLQTEYDEFSEFLNWGRRNPVLFAEELFGIEMMDYQKYIFMNTWITPYNVWLMSRNAGKALALDTPIPIAFEKYKPIGSIQIGDYVIGDDGEPAKVIMTSPIFINHNCYELLFDDDERIIADGEHLWSVLISTENGCNQFIDITTRIMYRLYEQFGTTFAIPKAGQPDDIGKRVIKINKVESVPTRCISVGNKSHRYLCGTKNTVTHNSILGAVYLQTRSLLVPNYTSYIICGVGSQSIETFSKIEKLTYNEIPSFTTLTDVYRGEVVKSVANSNGFVHNPSSHSVHLYNNSAIFTLNGNYNNTRSRRSNTNFYDEVMNAPDELFRVTEPFITQNAEFKLGVNQDNTDVLVEPLPFQNQLIFASSAGDKEQYLYTKYREASIHMDAGDPRYFCIDLTAPVILGATQHGVKLAKPLLTQEVIDSRLREDKEAGMREYFNEFTVEDHDKQIVSRATIIRNSVPRVPELQNPDNKKFYVLAYDPARQADNSVIGAAEVYKDEHVGWKMRIASVQSLIDVMKSEKTPVNTPEQIKILKRTILAYNGEGVADYENIKGILVDAGSGGAGVPITDFLCEDWKDKNGNMHRGLIDSEFNENDNRKFPNAVDGVLHLISPKKYKSDMFEALIQMLDLNLIEFTEEYSDKGYVNLLFDVYPDGRKVQRYKYPSEEEEEALNKKGIQIIFSPAYLTAKEENALKQIDLMKREITSIYRFKQGNDKDRFDLAPEKASNMNDDKAYILAMLGWFLAQLRRENITKKKKVDRAQSIAKSLPITRGKINKVIG